MAFSTYSSSQDRALTADNPSESAQPGIDARRNFFVVCLALTLCFVVYSMLIVAVPVYGLRLGASPLVLGAVLSTQYLLPLLFAIPLGGVVTRYGGRATLISGACLMVAGLLSMHFWYGYPGLVLGQLLVGLAHLQMVLAAQTIISNLSWTGTSTLLHQSIIINHHGQALLKKELVIHRKLWK